MTEDNNRKLDDCELELNEIKKWIDKNLIDSNVKYLVSYSVIKACGTIEIVLKSILYEYLSVNSKEETKTYLEKDIIDASFNPSTGQIGKKLEKFNSNKKKNFDDKLKETEYKNGLNSLVSLRNDIAHGRTNNVSINTVCDYFIQGKNILIILEDVLNN